MLVKISVASPQEVTATVTGMCGRHEALVEGLALRDGFVTQAFVGANEPNHRVTLTLDPRQHGLAFNGDTPVDADRVRAFVTDAVHLALSGPPLQKR